MRTVDKWVRRFREKGHVGLQDRTSHSGRSPFATHIATVEQIISRRELERLFKKYLQAVPSRYYLDLRLQQARRLLRDSDRPAGEIALATGFSSAAHFSTAYRNHFGVSPREERLV